MTKSAPLLLTLILLVFQQTNAQTNGDSWSSVKANGQGTLTCSYREVTGLIYEEDNLMKGVCVGILDEFSKYVKKEYGADLTIRYIHETNSMNDFLKKVQHTPKLLGISNTSITEERKRILDFSPPFLSNPAVLITNKNSESLVSLDNIKDVFQGYTAVVIKGTTHMKYIKDIKKNHFSDLKIEYLNSRDDIFDRLSNDDKVFTSIDFLLYFGAVKQKHSIKRHRVMIGSKTENLGFVIEKGSDWTSILSEFLSPEFRQSTQYKQIVSENIGSSFLYHIR